MSMFICAKLDEWKCMYTLQNTLNATLAIAGNSGSDLIINGTDVVREPQRQVTFINNLQFCLVTVMVGSILGFPCAGLNLPYYFPF